MPGTKEIRTKIASVKSTQKITKAMEMVAASKMRRAQERMKLARPYAAKMRAVIGNLTEANPDYRHPFLIEREPKSVGIIIISTDRGLCGGLNTNVFKSVIQLMREWQEKGAAIKLCILGTKGLAFFRRLGAADPGQRHRPRRSAARQGPDRLGQGDARRLPRRLDRPAVHGQCAVRQHDDAKAPGAAAAAGAGEPAMRSCSSTGITSTSPRPCRSSTAC